MENQKTINKYAMGEIEPAIEMKNKIYKAIAAYSGYEEDGITEEVLEKKISFPNGNLLQ